MEYFGTDLMYHGHYRWNLDGDEYMQKMYNRFEELPFDPEGLTKTLRKGDVAFYQGGGYTVIAIAGSCKDDRPGTKSVFWVKEIITRSEIIMQINQNHLAMKLIRAMNFEIKWEL